MAGQLPLTVQGYKDEFVTRTFEINATTNPISSCVPIFYAERDTVIDSVTLIVGTAGSVSTAAFDIRVGAGATPGTAGTTILTGTMLATTAGVVNGVIKTSPTNTPNNIVNGPITTPSTLGQVVQVVASAIATTGFVGLVQIRTRTRVA